MNIKNYTSVIPADKSVSAIEKALVSVGANNILKNYENQSLTSITFGVSIKGQQFIFQLPARVEVVFKMLWAEVKRPQSGTREKIEEQAERTAWKIILDWVEAQVAFIQLQQAEVMQVFLPYVFDPKSGETLYQKIKNSDFKQLNQ